MDWVARVGSEQGPSKALLSQSAPATFLAVSTLQEIKAAIDKLSPEERAELERLLQESCPEPPQPLRLPNQAERRRRIFGDKVLPNYVLLAREGKV